MTDQRHDYSRHAIHELERECVDLDPAKYPDRAKSLQSELVRRLLQTSASAAVVASDQALSVGARYSQLDPTAARKFLWPFLGFSLLFSFVAGFSVSFFASLTTGVLTSFRAFEEGSLTARVLNLAITPALAVPAGIIWLEVFTRRSFGGYGLRITRKGASDAV